MPGALAGERIDRVVALLTGLSRADAAALVEGGGVRVADRVVTTRSARLVEGSVVDVAVPAPAVAAALVADTSVAFDVVHVDDQVVVVDKPAGLVVHPGAGRRDATLVNGLLARFPDVAGVGEPGRPGIVHRLDKDTSGLLAVARTEEARRGLVAQLSDRTVTRRYLALVWGRVEVAQGVVDAPVGRSGRQPTRMAVSSRGRDARTGYEVLRTYSSPVATTRVVCRLETGRTHQIRVHLDAIGHPVVGDRRYGGARQSLPAPRQFLHAAHLGFTHPVSGKAMSFDSALPDDLDAVLGELS
ncbi:RluA family pseudouridine synthase [soil metagenome]